MVTHAKCPESALLLAAVALAVAAACPPAGPRDGAGAAVDPTERSVIAFDEQVLRFEPTRDDISVGRAVLAVHCPEPSACSIDGAEPSSSWTEVELAAAGRNRFRLPAVRIELEDAARVPLCISIKVFFAEVTYQYDALYYVEVDDRYALVSFCAGSGADADPGARARFSQNRVETLEAFEERLRRPFIIELNQRALPPPGADAAGSAQPPPARPDGE